MAGTQISLEGWRVLCFHPIQKKKKGRESKEMNQREIELSLQGCLQGMSPSWGGPRQLGELWERRGASWGYGMAQCLPGREVGISAGPRHHGAAPGSSVPREHRQGGRESSEEHQAVLIFSSLFGVWCIQRLANWAAKSTALGHCVCRGNLSIPMG